MQKPFNVWCCNLLHVCSHEQRRETNLLTCDAVEFWFHCRIYGLLLGNFLNWIYKPELWLKNIYYCSVAEVHSNASTEKMVGSECHALYMSPKASIAVAPPFTPSSNPGGTVCFGYWHWRYIISETVAAVTKNEIQWVMSVLRKLLHQAPHDQRTICFVHIHLSKMGVLNFNVCDLVF